MDSITKEELETVVDRLLNSPKPKPTFNWADALQGRKFGVVIFDSFNPNCKCAVDIETIKGLSLNPNPLVPTRTADD